MGVPYQAVDLGFVVLALALAASWLHPASVWRRLLRRRPEAAASARLPTFVRRAAAGLLVLVLAVFFGLVAVGAPLGSDGPLTTGGSFGGDDPGLLAISDRSGGQSQFEYAYRPGAEIRTGVSLANTGNLPLTVTGLHQPQGNPYVHGYTFMLPPGQLTSDPVALYPTDGPSWASEPFHPFEIAPNSEVGVSFAVDLNVCSQLTPVPTLAPGASPAESGLNFFSGFGAANVIDVDYTTLGISRSVELTLMTPMTVVTSLSGPGSPSGCTTPGS